MNGTASAVTGNANFAVWAVDTSGFIVDSFLGSASGATANPNYTVRFVDGNGQVCNGNDSAVPASVQRTLRVCSSTHLVPVCTNPSGPTGIKPNYTVNIIDNNGFVDDKF